MIWSLVGSGYDFGGGSIGNRLTGGYEVIHAIANQQSNNLSKQ